MSQERGVNLFIVTEHEGRKPGAFLEWFDKLARDERKGIVYRRLGIKANRGGVLKDGYHNIKRCIIPSNNVAINAYGRFVACCNDYFGQLVFGDLREKSVMKIWNSENYRQFRREGKRGDFHSTLCKSCGFSV